MFKVMIVDDIEIMRRSIKRLKLWGEASGFFITDEAKDGIEALSKLETNPVDLVITDIRMPRMDGIELIRRIGEKGIATCSVILSDYTEFNYARQGFAYGAFDYLGKPVEPSELVKLLERVQAHLIKKRQEEAAIRKLEEIAADKTESFYPKADVMELSELLKEGDTQVVQKAAILAETVASAVSYDSAKTAFIMKKAVNEVLSDLIINHQWIENFIDVNLIKNYDFAKYDSCSDLSIEFSDCIDNIVSTLNKFTGGYTENDLIKKVCRFVLTNTDTDISVKIISDSLFINRNYLSEVFKHKFGISLVEYLTMVKMERAKRLLSDSGMRNYEIANKLGFKDIEYFSKVFKKYTGITPTEFRNGLDKK